MIDYESLGLKCGLEIHQQIDSHKLFCNCPSAIRDDQPDIIVKRRLRAAAGETGGIDVAAAHEAEKQKYFVYQAYSDTTCLVELDCEPPHSLNEDALRVALQVSLMLKAKTVDAVQVMRKTVVDGSNTSGFQRTALVARNGILETGRGSISIPIICLEEEAAKIVERTADYDVYNLSRLGIPLIEIGTGPDIRSPEQAREVAEKLGMILRSTGRVKRGLGTIRQDINISIMGGARVEIKGAQELKLVSKFVENEALRQKNLLEIKQGLNEAKATVEVKVFDISTALKSCKSKIINAAETVLAVKLKNFKGFLGKEVQPGRRLGTELSDCAKIAGGVGGIIHSDELPGYGISAEDAEKIRKLLGCGEKDAFVLVADKKDKAAKAINAVTRRAKAALQKIPEEVRKANPDATTSFLRPMPGSSRMYPETDVLIARPEIKGITIPELRTDTASRLSKIGLGMDLANKVVEEGVDGFLEELAAKFKNIKSAFIAETLVSYAPELLGEKAGLDPGRIGEGHIRQVFSALNEGKIAKQAVMGLLREVASGRELDVERYSVISDAELEREIKRIISENAGMQMNALVGKAMEKLRNKADGKKIVEILRKVKG